MNKSNIEIEFKTAISKEKYLELLELFELEDNVFKQTNYYFDTTNLDLNSDYTVLRIRQKGNRYKLTLKKQAEESAFENHIILTKEQADDMILNGFNTKDFFSTLDYKVDFKSSLDNYRASAPYEEGVVFLDKCEYDDITDFEIEYEVNEYNEGKKLFEQLLDKHNIQFIKTRRKSERALKTNRN